jgi:hypothetical protein
MDDTEKQGPGDRTRINVNQAWELTYWTDALGVSEDRLRQIVDEVGPLVVDVRNALKAN